MFSSWLLPEVSYLPSVLARAELFRSAMPLTMIGYDALPMTEPANYRFTPGTSSSVSEYFRLLAIADHVVCISDYSRASILDRLRRDRRLSTLVAHPGGDHVPIRSKRSGPQGSVRFLRVGTLEARKMPLEIARAFELARGTGLDATLTFVGAPSASDGNINRHLREAHDRKFGLTWIADASDADVIAQIEQSDLFLSFGTEGYGIPVLEAIRFGIPVAFAGVQPAAELMDGFGATQITFENETDLADALIDIAPRIAQISAEVDPEAVPRWRDFTDIVARACSG